MANHRNNGHYDASLEDRASLNHLLGLFWRRRWSLLGCVAVAVGVGAAYLAQAPKIHKVGARLLVHRQDVAPQVVKTPPEKEFLATQAEIFRSPAVIERALASTQWRAKLDSETEAAKQIYGSLNVNPILGTNVISVSFQTTDTSEGVRTVGALIKSYEDYLRSSDEAAHVQEIGLLAENERSLRAKLKEQEDKYEQLRQRSPLMGTGRESAAIQMTLLTDLGKTVNETKNRRMTLQNQIEALNSGRTVAQLRPALERLLAMSAPEVATPLQNPIRQVSDGDRDRAASPLMARIDAANETSVPRFTPEPGGAGDTSVIEAELFRAEVFLRQLLQRFGPKHPEVKAAREQVVAWEELRREQLDSAPEVLQQDLVALRLHEEKLAALYEDEVQKTQALNVLVAQEQQALKEIERLEAVHQNAFSQLKQWELSGQALAEGRSGVSVAVLDGPAVAEDPVWPPPAVLFLAACGVVGLIGGAGLVSLLDRPSTDIHAAPDRMLMPPEQPIRNGASRNGTAAPASPR